MSFFLQAIIGETFRAAPTPKPNFEMKFEQDFFY